MAETDKYLAPRDFFAPLRRGHLFDWVLDDRLPAPWDTAELAMPVDISRKDNTIIVRASVPGFDAKEIDVQVINGVLSIKGEHKEESETKDERYFRRERRSEYTSRQVELPEAVDEAQVAAEYKNGVLTVTAPLATGTRTNRVEVKSA